MRKYFKNIDDEYITYIGTGCGSTEITQEEYENILSIIHNRPIPEDGYDYKLRTDLTWELAKVEITSDDDREISSDELAYMLEEVL